ncbi:MAG: peptide chain release factor N(5)-glutamine methyltransferase [Defluviitaleaceae bacterium]|nr:peptide chain release factor N(5)-glutamine methyltransferase [Defluviitaleaceae bacterium]
MTLDDALRYGAKKIGKRDAKLLLSHITGYSTSGIMLHCLREITDSDFAAYDSCLERRRTGEPLQYIMGQWDFMGLTLRTDKRALIPRPETELLVDAAQPLFADYMHSNQHARLEASEKKSPLRVLDVCTGSGCIALAIARLTDGLTEITAVDISDEALSLAKENAEKLGLAGQINFIKSDMLDAVSGEFDVIISNPPYILSGEMASLSPTVRDYEPHLALDGGADGLDFYRRLIPQSFKALRAGGALFLEIGPVAVLELMADAGFENINMMRDYAELERIVYGVKPNV